MTQMSVPPKIEIIPANAPFSDDTPATHSLVTQLGSGTEKTK